MKAKISISVLLMVILTSLLTVMGQDKSDKKKQEEESKKTKEQVVIITDKQKDSEKDLQKAMAESLAAEEKALKARKDLGIMDNKAFLKDAEALQDYKQKLEEMKTKQRDSWESHLNYSYAPPMRFQNGAVEIADNYGLYSGDRENTSLSISKTLEEITFSTDFYYDVKTGSSTISFFVTGTLDSGELSITLSKPDKTDFQEITISPLADVNWNQTFRWDESESKEYMGKWIISITAEKAKGNYRVQVNSR